MKHRSSEHDPHVRFTLDPQLTALAEANKTGQYFAAARMMERHGYALPDKVDLPLDLLHGAQMQQLRDYWSRENTTYTEQVAPGVVVMGECTLVAIDSLLCYVGKYLHKKGLINNLFDQLINYWYICGGCHDMSEFISYMPADALINTAETITELVNSFPLWHMCMDDGNESYLVYAAPYHEVQERITQRFPFLHMSFYEARALYRSDADFKFNLYDERGKISMVRSREEMDGAHGQDISDTVRNHYFKRKLHLLIGDGDSN